MQWSGGAVEAWRGTKKTEQASHEAELRPKLSPGDHREGVGDRMLGKLTSIMDTTSHPLHQTVQCMQQQYSAPTVQEGALLHVFSPNSRRTV